MEKTCETNLSLATSVMRTRAYVDDILPGSQSLPLASKIIKALYSIVFPLKKIISNHSEITKNIKKENLLHTNFLKFEKAGTTKNTGIQWKEMIYQFSYIIESISVMAAITKRQILSSITKLFNPAGWFSPITIKRKITTSEQ